MWGLSWIDLHQERHRRAVGKTIIVLSKEALNPLPYWSFPLMVVSFADTIVQMTVSGWKSVGGLDWRSLIADLLLALGVSIKVSLVGLLG